MMLKKFKFLTNRFLNEKRERKRGEVIKVMNKAIISSLMRPVISDTKYKYVMKLPLYTSTLREKMGFHTDEGNCFIENSKYVRCDTRWPICFFDHTYKSKCISYFRFRSAEPCEFIDDYFADRTISSGEKHKTIVSRAAAADEELKGDLQTSHNTTVSTREGPAESQVEMGATVTTAVTTVVAPAVDIYDTLLIERSIHYCRNTTFVNNIKRLLQQKTDYDSAFPMTYVHLLYDEEQNSRVLMDKFVDYISTYDTKFENRRESVASLELAAEIMKERWSAPKSGEPDEDEKESPTKNVDVMGSISRVRKNNKLVLPATVNEFQPEDHILLDMVENTPYENGDEIVANSPTGKLLRKLHPQDQRDPVDSPPSRPVV